MTGSLIDKESSWERLAVILFIGLFHCVTVAKTAVSCNQELDYGDDVELTLDCVSTRPSATYERLDYMDTTELFLASNTIIQYTCVHPNGTILADNERLVASTAVSLAREIHHLVDPGTNCTFSGCYQTPMTLTQLETRLLSIREKSCITDSANECLNAEHNNCSVGNAVCINTVGSYECHCSRGYEGNGFQCENIDECSSGMHNCSENATCTDSDGSFTCTCKDGYEGDGYYNNCTDINECTEGGTENCSKDAHCVNMDGGFVCVCRDGYDGDGFNCTKMVVNVTDTNEVSTVTDGVVTQAVTNGGSTATNGVPTEPGAIDMPKSSRTYNFLVTVLVPCALSLLVILLLVGVVVCVLVSTFVIKSRRKPKILALYNDISNKDTLDDNYFPVNPESPILNVRLCQSQISILDILKPTLNPISSGDSVQELGNEELQYITHCKIDTSHSELNAKPRRSQDPGRERNSCSDDSLSIIVVGSSHRSTQLTVSDCHQSITGAQKQCITPQQSQSLLQPNIENQSNDRIDKTMQDESLTHIQSTNNSDVLTEQQRTDTNSPQKELFPSSPVYLEHMKSHDNSNNLHYYTDSEGYVELNSSCTCGGCVDHHHDTNTCTDCENISQVKQ